MAEILVKIGHYPYIHYLCFAPKVHLLKRIAFPFPFQRESYETGGVNPSIEVEECLSPTRFLAVVDQDS